MTQSSNKHLSLEMKHEILKVKKEFDEKPHAKDLEIRQIKQDLKAKEMTIQDLTRKLTNIDTEKTDPFKEWNRSLALKNKLNFDIFTTPRCPYVWTFENFKEKFEVANKSKYHDHFYSNNFFTEQGYKGRTYINLRGIQDGKNTHLSLFFYNTKGPYDEFLEWPIPFKSLTFTLIVNGVEIAKAFVRSTDDGGKWKDVFKKPTRSSSSSKSARKCPKSSGPHVAKSL